MIIKLHIRLLSNENNSLHVSDLRSASSNFTYEAWHERPLKGLSWHACIFVLAIWHDRNSDSVIYGSGPTFIPTRSDPDHNRVRLLYLHPYTVPARSDLIRLGLAIRSDYYTCLYKSTEKQSYVRRLFE